MEILENKNEKTKLIDIEKVISDKNPKLYRSIPKFVIRYIKKTIHQKDLNKFIQANNDKFGFDFLKETFIAFDVSAEIVNKEKLPENGKYIFVANHPIGSFDGLHLIGMLYEKYGKVKAVVNDVLLNLKNLNDFFVGVNLHGSTPREQVENLSKIFEMGVPVLFFPSGKVSRKENGIITDKEWKKTFISRAIKHKLDIVPIHVEGRLSNKFYRIANLRKKIGIKSNIEMFFLVDEVFKIRGSKLKITIGEAISYKTFDNSKNHYNWAQEVKEHVYKIAKNPNIKFTT
ncbi:MAG: glycerol acyltransferase [Chlorobi bacterium]|nr:glycerol acyltransferase [Chlorobiota bacterium]